MKMNRPLVFLTMGFVLSLMLLSTVNGSTSVMQGFQLCNQGVWNTATTSGQVQINICTQSGGGQGSVQYLINDNGATVAYGGCNGGPCSYPTISGVNANSYLILHFYPNYISGIQVIEPDNYGIVRQVWVPYNYQSTLCNPFYQICYTQSSYCTSQSCSAVIFRIVATPITVNVFFSL